MLELADTSAWWSSRRKPDVRTQFDAQVLLGEIATCDMVKLELLYSARNPAEFAAIRHELDMLPQCPIGPAEWRRAVDIYEELCQRGPGNHRSVDHEDLLIAAAAEAAGVGLVHYDKDHETIAEITEQPARWLAPKGSL